MAATILPQMTALDFPVDKDIMFLIKMEIGVDWTGLAEKILPGAEVDAIKCDHYVYGIKEMAYQSLRKWTQREPDQATVKLLIYHLEEIGRTDVAHKVREAAIARSTLFKTPQSAVDVFLALTNHSQEDWKPLALRLLSPQDVDMIEKSSLQYGRNDMLYQCFQLWERQQRKPASVQNLLDTISSKATTDTAEKGLAEKIFKIVAETPVEPTSVAYSSKQYNMNYPRRGIVLIFNQKTFTNRPAKTREGTDKDRDELVSMFKYLRFHEDDILIREDFTKKEIEEELLRVSKKVNHSNHACLVVVMLSHGGNGYVETSDNCEMSHETLWKNFHGAECKSLGGKPKLFILQACQGTESNSSLQVDSDEQTDATTFVPPIPQYYTDLLIAYATPPGFLSIRNTRGGSWFIQTLCRELTRQAHIKDVASILTDINNEVTQRSSSSYGQQIPGYTSFLRKSLVFTPRN